MTTLTGNLPVVNRPREKTRRAEIKAQLHLNSVSPCRNVVSIVVSVIGGNCSPKIRRQWHLLPRGSHRERIEQIVGR
jgi:hypothetical protein